MIKVGGVLGEVGKQYSDAFKNATSAIGSANPLRKYNPSVGDYNEKPFTDTRRSQRQINELVKQREGVKGREFEGAQAAKLGMRSYIDPAQLGDANQMTAAQLAEAERIQAAKLAQDQQEFRAGQQDFIAALQKQAAGQGPSLAGMQLQDARNQQIETAMALAASQRGLGAGQGLRSIAEQTQNANQFAAREAARARIAEQLSAQQLLGGALSGARAQDIGFAEAQAGLEQQAALANQSAANQFALAQGAMSQEAAARNQAALNDFALQQGSLNQQAALANQATANQFELQQAAMNQQTALANLQGRLANQTQTDAAMAALNQQIAGLSMGEQEALRNLEILKMQRELGLEGLRSGASATQQQNVLGFIGGLAGAGATVASAGKAAPAAAAASDENLKHNIKTSDKEISSFLEAIKSHSYDYKDKKWGDGRYISPMAQELEKSSIGRSMVIDTPEGKIVDYARGSGTYLAAASMLNRRLKEIEKRLAKKRA